MEKTRSPESPAQQRFRRRHWRKSQDHATGSGIPCRLRTLSARPACFQLNNELESEPRETDPNALMGDGEGFDNSEPYRLPAHFTVSILFKAMMAVCFPPLPDWVGNNAPALGIKVAFVGGAYRQVK